MAVALLLHSCSCMQQVPTKLSKGHSCSLLAMDFLATSKVNEGSTTPKDLHNCWPSQRRQHTHSCQCFGLQQDWQLEQSSG